jgi:hypothetical protein
MVDDMILCVEISKYSIRNLLELKKKSLKSNPVHSNCKNKIFRNNLAKKVDDPYNKNYENMDEKN